MTDVVVVGGGPAGSLTALLVARAGYGVTVVDRARFPRPKACGECLNPGAVVTLGRHRLLETLDAHGPARLLGWHLLGPLGGSYRASFPDARTGRGIDRTVLDHQLLLAARDAGARVREGVRVTGLRARPGAEAAEVELADGSVLRARVVIGADGLHSTVARTFGATGVRRPKKASLSLHLEGVSLAPDRGTLLAGGPFTVGLAPLDLQGRRWTLTVVAATSDAGLVPRGGEGLVGFAAGRCPALGRALAVARPVGAPLGSGPFVRPASVVARGGVLLVGDAAGYYDPLTGQGLFGALRSAELAAAAAVGMLDAPPRARAFERAYRQTLTESLRPTRRLQRLIELARRRPRLFEAALKVLARQGALDELIAVVGDLRRPSSLLRPSFLAGLVTGPAAP